MRKVKEDGIHICFRLTKRQCRSNWSHQETTRTVLQGRGVLSWSPLDSSTPVDCDMSQVGEHTYAHA